MGESGRDGVGESGDGWSGIEWGGMEWESVEGQEWEKVGRDVVRDSGRGTEWERGEGRSGRVWRDGVGIDGLGEWGGMELGGTNW